jgi:alkylation response protein AidB-like acyl-CoA dehydrogenase
MNALSDLAASFKDDLPSLEESLKHSLGLAELDPRYTVPGSALELTDEQRSMIELAERVGQTRLAPRAARWDKEASFPFENYDDLRKSGLLALCVPKEYGGMGADLYTYSMVSATLGKYCGATALTFNMHACSSLWPGALADALEFTPEQRAEHLAHRAIHFKRIVEEGAIYAQPFSEGTAAAAGKAPFGTLAKKVDGGWIINGKKIFASLSGAANYYGLLCTEDKEGASMRDSLYIAIPAIAEGVSIVGDWDPLGMRGTVSRTLILKDVFVPDSAQMMPRGMYAQAAARWPHMFTTLSPTYMGISIAAYEFTVKYLRGEIEGMGPPVKRRQFATKQITVAQIHILLEQTRALFLRCMQEARVDPGKDVRLRAYASQYTIMENANEICRLAIRTCGGQSMLKTLKLERLYRDSRCGSLMLPWTAELCMDRLGREALYEPGETDE